MGLPLTFAAALLTGIVLAGPAASGEFGCAVKPVASLPTTDDTFGQPTIRIGLGGRDRPFILDTGAPMSTVRESIVEELHLPHMPIPLTQASGASGRPFQEQTVIDAVTFDRTTLQSVPFLIQPRTHADDAGFVGLIGAALFGKFDVELDYGHHLINFFDPGACRPRGMEQVPLIVAPSGHVLTRVELDDERVTALIDTGASHSIVTLNAAHRLWGLDTRSPGVRLAGAMITADGGRVDAYQYAFKTLVLRGLTVKDPMMALVPDETRRLTIVRPAGTAPPAEAEGLPDLILGMSELRRMHLLIAYRDRMLYASLDEE